MSAAAVRTEFLKWVATIQISWSSRMAYKLNFVLLVIAPTVVFYFIKFNIWSAIFDSTQSTHIMGFDRQRMISYQSRVMIIGFIAQGHNSMALGEDIRLGRISAHLIYPFDFWRYHAADFLAFQLMQVVVTILSVTALLSIGVISWPGWLTVLCGFAFCSLVSVLWFACQFVLGLFAFWLEESWTLRVMFATVAQFLSGSILPLDIYPEWFRNMTSVLPFAEMTYIPSLIFMNQFEGSILQSILRLLVWIFVVGLSAIVVWRRGIRMYTGAGM